MRDGRGGGGGGAAAGAGAPLASAPSAKERDDCGGGGGARKRRREPEDPLLKLRLACPMCRKVGPMTPKLFSAVPIEQQCGVCMQEDCSEWTALVKCGHIFCVGCSARLATDMAVSQHAR